MLIARNQSDRGRECESRKKSRFSFRDGERPAMQADDRKHDSERCFAAAMRCCEDPLLVCALQTARENDNGEIGYLNEE